MPGTGHTMHTKQQQPLIKVPHRRGQQKIMLGLQVIYQRPLSPHPFTRTENGCALAIPAMRCSRTQCLAHLPSFMPTSRNVQMPMWESINGSFLKVSTQGSVSAACDHLTQPIVATSKSIPCRPVPLSSSR